MNETIESTKLKLDSINSLKHLIPVVQLPREKLFYKLLMLNSNSKKKHKHKEILLDGITPYSQNNVFVKPDQIKGLENKLESILIKLSLDKDIEIIIDPSPGFQASMFSNPIDDKFCLIMSSGLIENLITEELLYVCGHELGHHYLKHSQIKSFDNKKFNDKTTKQKLLNLSLSRSQEVSADRFGLVFCNNDINVAVSALLKISTQSKFDQLDITAEKYSSDDAKLSELRFFDAELDCYQPYSLSHPPLHIRIKLLRLFSDSFKLNDEFLDYRNFNTSEVNKQCDYLLDSLEADGLKQKQEIDTLNKHILVLQKYIYSKSVSEKKENLLLDSSKHNSQTLKKTYQYINRFVSRGRKMRIIDYILSSLNYHLIDIEKPSLLELGVFNETLINVGLPPKVRKKFTAKYKSLFQINLEKF